MKAKPFVAKAELLLNKAFPDYLVRLVPDPDDAATFFAYAFNIPEGMEKEITDRMYDVIEEDLDGNGFDVIPSVTNLTATKEYYPQYFRASSSSRDFPRNDIVMQVLKDSPCCDQGDGTLFDFSDEELDAIFDHDRSYSEPPVSENIKNECQLAIAA